MQKGKKFAVYVKFKSYLFNSRNTGAMQIGDGDGVAGPTFGDSEGLIAQAPPQNPTTKCCYRSSGQHRQR
jgi:hypothetical protein